MNVKGKSATARMENLKRPERIGKHYLIRLANSNEGNPLISLLIDTIQLFED